MEAGATAGMKRPPQGWVETTTKVTLEERQPPGPTKKPTRRRNHWDQLRKPARRRSKYWEPTRLRVNLPYVFIYLDDILIASPDMQ